MCGFTGFIGETSNSSAVLEQMMNTIIHRGPDSFGMFIDNKTALGFRRLSIYVCLCFLREGSGKEKIDERELADGPAFSTANR